MWIKCWRIDQKNISLITQQELLLQEQRQVIQSHAQRSTEMSATDVEHGVEAALQNSEA